MTTETGHPQQATDATSEPPGPTLTGRSPRPRRSHHGPDPVEPPASSPYGRRLTSVVAVAVMVVYIGALWLLFTHRADANWDRMVYLLTGYEAIVFVAVGALFGTTVQRAAVQVANAHAREARADVRSERARADDAVSQGERGAILAASVRSIAGSGTRNRTGQADVTPSGLRGQPHGEGQAGPGPGPQGLDFLLRLSDQLFPPGG